jgi:hypothetical protein
VISRQDRLLVATTHRGIVFKKDINPFIITDSKWNLNYVLGVLNSKFVSWLYLNSSSIATKDDFRQTTLAELRRLPIPRPINAKKAKHDQLVAHVERMLKLHTDLAAAKIPRRADSPPARHLCDRPRHRPARYQLYALTAEEIALVEAGHRPHRLQASRR